jgi:hypothetical protein
MICDFVNAIIFSSFSIPCQGRTTRIPQQYKKWPPEGNKNKTADEGLESGAKTTPCQPRFIGRRLEANSRCAVRAVNWPFKGLEEAIKEGKMISFPSPGSRP